MAGILSLIENTSTSLSRRNLLIVGVIAFISFALLLAIYFSFIRVSYRAIFKDLRDSDAATIVADLEKRKIPYRLEDDGKSILVPSKIADSVRLAESTGDLPLKGMVGFELFNKSDIGLTEFAQKINYRRALQGELSRTIMSMDTIEFARVHLAIPESSVFRDDRQAAKASVTISPRAGQDLSSGIVVGIQQLVASAVPDLAPSDVVVLNEHGDVISDATAPVPRLTSPPSVSEQAAIEQFYSARIRQALTRFFPDDQLDVSVKAVAPVRSLEEASGRDGKQSYFENWAPTSRQFGLNISVGVASEFGPEVRDQIQVAASQAVGLGAVGGDMLNVVTSQRKAPSSLAPNLSQFVPPPPPPPANASILQSVHSAPRVSPLTWVFVALGVGLLGLAVLITRIGSRGRLTKGQRAQYGAKLRALLDEQGAHAS